MVTGDIPLHPLLQKFKNFFIGQRINIKNLYNYENANYSLKIMFKYYNK